MRFLISLIAWNAALAGIVLILLAFLSALTGKLLLHVEHGVNYFHAANSFFLITIAAFIYLFRSPEKKH